MLFEAGHLKRGHTVTAQATDTAFGVEMIQ